MINYTILDLSKQTAPCNPEYMWADDESVSNQKVTLFPLLTINVSLEFSLFFGVKLLHGT